MKLTCIVITVVFTSISWLCSQAIAQTRYNTVEELAAFIQNGDKYSKDSAIDYLRWRHGKGEDISAAIPALKNYFPSQQNLDNVHGVNDYGPKFVLLALMDAGDEDAINLYLTAQKIHTSRNGYLPRIGICDSSECVYLESIRPKDYATAYSIYSSYYVRMRKQAAASAKDERHYVSVMRMIAPHALHWLARFAEDKQPIVDTINQWWVYHQKYPEIFSWYKFLPAVIVLADESTLLPEIVQTAERYDINRLRDVTEGEAAMVAAMSPFRTEAYSFLANMLSNKEMSSQWRSLIAIYVDSASRLRGEQREQANQKLREIAQPAFDNLKLGSGWTYISYGFGQRPRFIESREKLKQEIFASFRTKLAEAN
ncbi:hypothetical protein [Rubinisphaera sp.]|uniref:hypothetical protein n=1 Tax=Rubinisphaera sp. TaxID=2024857 RepID=UPI000C11AB47|nr:hypothetical protein [Rubinisphaera sp.]MBV08282.1 hypothetical protein [Rubinisphaera sp.]HCS55068.1 hypothetical protein [Planctomycetaceae bacterium]